MFIKLWSKREGKGSQLIEQEIREEANISTM